MERRHVNENDSYITPRLLLWATCWGTCSARFRVLWDPYTRIPRCAFAPSRALISFAVLGGGRRWQMEEESRDEEGMRRCSPLLHALRDAHQLPNGTSEQPPHLWLLKSRGGKKTKQKNCLILQIFHLAPSPRRERHRSKCWTYGG